MGKRRGWQIAGVAGLWLSYGGFVLWPTLHDWIGDRLYAVSLALLIAVLGWVTIAVRRAINARLSRFAHWEMRFPIESLFLMLLAPSLFAFDCFLAVATQHSLADAPFAQIGWATFIFFGVATFLALIGGLSYATLWMPMPAPGGYRDVVKTPQESVDPSSQKIHL